MAYDQSRVYRFADISGYPLKRRLIIRAVDFACYVLIRALGATLRVRGEGLEHGEQASRDGSSPIYAFWHDRIFIKTYFWQRRGIVVMTSQSFDGEYIARIIQRFGFGAVRGSSKRGGATALVEMARLVRNGIPVAFTIDGPQGPRHVAKLGAVLLAKKTGRPVVPGSAILESAWEVRSWDRLLIPKPFSRAIIRLGAPIHVPGDADEDTLAAKREQLQQALDGLSV
ncbi:MAG TPA: lysophospholipid acyltransferase family protein [Xanthobacteraceae bacterium]